MRPVESRWEDRARFRELIERYGGVVLSIAESFTSDPDEVEDLFQEIWATAWAKRDQHAGRGSWGNWILIMARNTCRSRYRSEAARARRMRRYARESPEEENAWRQQDPLEGLEERERAAELHRAMETLPEREHEAVVLRIMEGKSTAEVAEAMGCKRATVRSFLRKAVGRLRESMDQEPLQEPNGANGG